MNDRAWPHDYPNRRTWCAECECHTNHTTEEHREMLAEMPDDVTH